MASSEIFTKGAAYILVMKSGSQHCLVFSSSLNDGKCWLTGRAGISRLLCLYEESPDNPELKLVVEDAETIRALFGGKRKYLTKGCLVVGPEMMVNKDEVAIIEKSASVLLPEECFLENLEINTDVVVGHVPELKQYWNPNNGFRRPEFKIVEG